MTDVDGQPDSLFFQQLMLPIHNINNTNVLTAAGDPCKTFYSNVARWSNLYACEELAFSVVDMDMNSKPKLPLSACNGTKALLWMVLLVEAKALFSSVLIQERAIVCSAT